MKNDEIATICTLLQYINEEEVKKIQSKEKEVN